MLDTQTAITSAGTSGSPATLSGYWQLDQTLKGSINGNAGTATALQNSVLVNGSSFTGNGGSFTVNLNTTSVGNNATYYPTFVPSNSAGNQQASTVTSFSINPGTGALSATSFVGSGSSLSGVVYSVASGTGTSVSTTSGVATVNIGQSVGTSASPQFSGLYLENSSNPSGDSGSIYWYIAGLSANTVFRTYQRAADNNIVTTYSSNLGGPGNVTTTIYNMDSSGNITTQGNFTAYSDLTLKDNILTISNALNKVSQTRGVTYTRRDLEDKQRRYTGVIAQEIEAVLPEAVMTDADGIKSVAYGNVIGLLIEAIKELDAKVDSLQKQLNEKNNDTTNN